MLFETFLENHRQVLSEGGWPQLETLLEQEDDLLYDWISGRDLPDDPQLIDLINTITDVA